MSIGLGLPGAVQIAETPDQVATSVAHWVRNLSSEAIASRGHFNIALAGGTTPLGLYSLMADPSFSGGVDWSAWRVFFTDERACPPDSPDSNYGTIHMTLLSKVPVANQNVFRMAADALDLDAAVTAYAEALVAQTGDDDGIPRLDCVILGIGENGHTASLFPGDPSLSASGWCARGRADYEPFDRITLSFPSINAAHHVGILATGSKKVEALKEVVEGVAPAALVRPHPGRLHWFLDRAADGA